MQEPRDKGHERNEKRKDKRQEEIIISGFGGQGALFAGQLLAYAAMDSGYHVTWIPSYGPEMRGGKARCTIVVSDDVDSARRDGEMRRPELTIRFSSFCVEDEIEIRFNGQALPLDTAEVTDERALHMATKPGKTTPVEAPLGLSAHWFRFRLDPDLLVRGENRLEVETRGMSKTADFERSINGVEIRMRYRDFARPEGLVISRIEL